MAEENYAYTDEEGVFLVKLARETVETIVTSQTVLEVPEEVPPKLQEESGVFVTLNKITSGQVRIGPSGQQLRGCIGRPYPQFPLVKATIDSAIDAATHDPRFPPVVTQELDQLIVEVTALTPPVLLETETPQDRLHAIKIGRDGLLIESDTRYGPRRGLFLPQVPIEWHWDEKEYLVELCGKAGL